MKPESVRLVAEAIYNAENGIDGDPIAVLISDSDLCHLVADNTEEVQAFCRKICQQAAQAAIRAVMQTDEVRGLIAALELYQAIDDEAYRMVRGFSAKKDDVDKSSPARKALSRLETSHAD